MKVVQHFGRIRNVWKPSSAGSQYWNGETVTKLWDGVWMDLSPLFLTTTKYIDERDDSRHKSQVGDIVAYMP